MDRERIAKLFFEKKESLIQILVLPHVWESLENYSWYLRTLDACKLVLVHESWLLDSRSAQLLLDQQFASTVTFLYVEALIDSGNVSAAILCGEKFLIESGLCENEIVSESWFVGRSEIQVSFLSKLAYTLSVHTKRRSYLCLAIELDPTNFEAIRQICTNSFEMDLNEKLSIIGRIKAKIADKQFYEYIRQSLAIVPTSGTSSETNADEETMLCTSLLELKFRRSFPTRDSLAYKDINLAGAIVPHLYVDCDVQNLYSMSNFFMKNYPNHINSFFTAGVYYLVISRFDVARKFLAKSCLIDGGLPHTWIASGLAFSKSDETVHAISAFRSATNKYPKLVLPWLYLGMEYIRTNELKLAQTYLVSALELGGNFRSLILNEISIICILAQQFDVAVNNLQIAISEQPNEYESIFYANMGYAYIRMNSLEDGVKVFDKAVSLNDQNGNAIAGLAFCLHCRGSLSRAIDLYNKALPLIKNKKIENLITNLIQLAISEFSLTSWTNDHEMVAVN